MCCEESVLSRPLLIREYVAGGEKKGRLSPAWPVPKTASERKPRWSFPPRRFENGTWSMRRNYRRPRFLYVPSGSTSRLCVSLHSLLSRSTHMPFFRRPSPAAESRSLSILQLTTSATSAADCSFRHWRYVSASIGRGRFKGTSGRGTCFSLVWNHLDFWLFS